MQQNTPNLPHHTPFRSAAILLHSPTLHPSFLFSYSHLYQAFAPGPQAT